MPLFLYGVVKMVDVIKRRIVGVSEDTGELVKIDMENITEVTFSTGLPDTTSVATGEALTLTVALTGGLEPYKVQWYKDGNAIADATGLTYTKASAAATDAGVYKVVVLDSYGNVEADSTTVSVTA